MEKKRNKRQKGAILITLIIAIVVIALSGSAMLYFSTTSTYGELFTNRQERAYYVGESGINYALQRYLADKTLFPISAPAVKTLSSGDQFSVSSEIVSKGSPAEDWLVIKSTGVVGTGWLTTRQLVTKEMKKALAVPPGMAPPTTDSSGVPIGFDANTTTQPDDPTNPLDNTWEVVDLPKTDYTIYNGDLLFVGTEAAITLNPSNINLCEAWASNGNFSSYFLQVKVQNSSNPQHFLVGLSFRLKGVQIDSDAYGLSFYRFDASNNCPSSIDWCQNSYGVQRFLKADNKMYAVLWKRISNRYYILAYAEMNASYGVSNNGDLLAWSTLLVRINERSDGNHIKAYVKQPTIPATGYIDWNISGYKPVMWTATCSATSCSSVTPFAEMIDNTFLSTGFCTGSAQNWPEIGIHGFYDMSCNKCQFFDDFGASVLGTGGGGSQY